MSAVLAKVIKTNSHIDYVGQVFGKGEVEHPPAPEDYAVGTWVEMPAGTDRDTTAVGIIYNTQLYNPAYGTFGPRLSSDFQLEVFSPDYLNETAILLGILVVGQMRGSRRLAGGYCPVIAGVGAAISAMSDERVRSFHTREDSLALEYYSLIMAIRDPLIPPLMLDVLTRLRALLPNQAVLINSLRTSIAWQTHVAAGKRS